MTTRNPPVPAAPLEFLDVAERLDEMAEYLVREGYLDESEAREAAPRLIAAIDELPDRRPSMPESIAE